MTTRDHSRVADRNQVSDGDRDRAVSELTRHCGDGRLTLEELEHRITEVYAAVTKAELAIAMRELPPIGTGLVSQSGPPVRVKPSDAPMRVHDADRAGEIALKVHLYTYVSVIAFLVAIYVLTNLGGYFWPIWPAMGWGVAIAIHAGAHKAATSTR